MGVIHRIPTHAVHTILVYFMYSFAAPFHFLSFVYHVHNILFHSLHSLMHHPPPLESHAVHHDSTCTFNSFLHHSTSLSFLYHVHNHSCSPLAFIAATPLPFTPMLCIITSLSPLNHFNTTPFYPCFALHFLYKRKCVWQPYSLVFA